MTANELSDLSILVRQTREGGCSASGDGICARSPTLTLITPHGKISMSLSDSDTSDGRGKEASMAGGGAPYAMPPAGDGARPWPLPRAHAGSSGAGPDACLLFMAFDFGGGEESSAVTAVADAGRFVAAVLLPSAGRGLVADLSGGFVTALAAGFALASDAAAGFALALEAGSLPVFPLAAGSLNQTSSAMSCHLTSPSSYVIM